MRQAALGQRQQPIREEDGAELNSQSRQDGEDGMPIADMSKKPKSKQGAPD